MLLILDIISITQVTGGGVNLIPCRCLKTQGVNTKLKFQFILAYKRVEFI